MEFHQLRYFVAVAEERSFSRAAERVRVAQPSLSQQIQKLEAELGQPLFDRLPRGINLTDAGERLLGFARRILNEAAEARRCLDEAKSETAGVLSVGMIPTLAPYILRPILTRFRALHPQVSIHVKEDVTDNLLRAIEDGEIDLAIVSTCRNNSTAARQLLGSEQLLAALPEGHRCARAETLPADALASEPLIMLHETHCLSRQIMRWCRQSGIRPQATLSAVQLSTVVAMIATGQGISIVPEMAIRQEQGRGCIFIPFRDSPPEREINLIRNPSRHTTKAGAAFARVAQEALQKILAESRAAKPAAPSRKKRRPPRP